MQSALFACVFYDFECRAALVRRNAIYFAVSPFHFVKCLRRRRKGLNALSVFERNLGQLIMTALFEGLRFTSAVNQRPASFRSRVLRRAVSESGAE